MAFLEGSNQLFASDPIAAAPSAANPVELFEYLLAYITNQSATAVGSIVTAGTGYAVGDLLRVSDSGATEVFSITDGTKNSYTILEVTSVSGGTVTGVRIRNAGSYSTLPTAVSGTEYATVAITGGGDDAFTVNLTFANLGWTIRRQTTTLTGVAINAAGTGYSASDVVTPTGGDTRSGYTNPQTNNFATVTIDTVGGSGEATAVSVTTAGIYHRTPGTTAIAVTGGGGSGLTLDLTFSAATADTIQREAILEGPDGAFVGIRTYTDGSTIVNWEIAGMTGYTADNDFEAQPNISPGRYNESEAGNYVILRTTDIHYFFEVDDRRIVMNANIDTGVYCPMYLGYLDPYATSAEYPEPLLVMGCSSNRGFTVASDPFAFLGMNCAVSGSSGDLNGPGSVYGPGGGWYQVKNGHFTGSEINGDEDRVHIFPGGWYDPQDSSLTDADKIVGGTGTQKQDWESFASVATATGASGADPPTEQHRPQGAADENHPQFPLVVAGLEPIKQIFGELGGCKFVNQNLNTGVISAEAVSEDGTNVWQIFNNCQSTERQHWWALKVG